MYIFAPATISNYIIVQLDITMKPLYQELPFSVEHYINFYREDLPYFIVPWHYHPEIEIMCIEQGSGTRFVGDHIENYEVGDVCIIGPQLPHEWRNDKEFFGEGTGLRSVCLCVYFRKELFEGVMINLPEFMNIRNLIERSRRGIKFTGTARDRIADFIRSTFNSNGAVRVTNLITLLEMMANTEEYELLASVGFTQSVNSSDFERFNKIYQYLVKNFNQPIKLEEVAGLVGLTPTAFCRYFKERTKKTFVQYLNDMRIGHAKRLLIEGKMKISTVSMEVGFNNLSNFIEQFKKSVHMLPTEYQKQYGVKNKKAI